MSTLTMEVTPLPTTKAVRSIFSNDEDEVDQDQPVVVDTTLVAHSLDLNYTQTASQLHDDPPADPSTMQPLDIEALMGDGEEADDIEEAIANKKLEKPTTNLKSTGTIGEEEDDNLNDSKEMTEAERQTAAAIQTTEDDEEEEGEEEGGEGEQEEEENEETAAAAAVSEELAGVGSQEEVVVYEEEEDVLDEDDDDGAYHPYRGSDEEDEDEAVEDDGKPKVIPPLPKQMQDILAKIRARAAQVPTIGPLDEPQEPVPDEELPSAEPVELSAETLGDEIVLSDDEMDDDEFASDEEEEEAEPEAEAAEEEEAAPAEENEEVAILPSSNPKKRSSKTAELEEEGNTHRPEQPSPSVELSTDSCMDLVPNESSSLSEL